MNTISYTDNFLIGLFHFFVWAKWLLLAALALTCADLRFGIAASRYRGELVKFSRAVRRTVDKIIGFVMWIVMAYAFGKAFGQPFGIELLPLIMLLVIYCIEAESVYVNYYAARGKRVKVKFYKLLGKKADLIEFEEEKEETKNDNNRTS
ncbi:hypothetical protein M2132_000813 [Dysgonomonas sp. PH5-45]|uniref:phage holin family protein n=1 Tax=unclassified Dysgonomonas TaxID=2630389 RepID=UPI002475294F|nr:MULTISPECIES: phage holin family protein [unclassified Dysgonomonas]MDH6354485.1 hypothetical protein [Dysgonomonas sp. PH5-45]MDH6387458.1 hypothetical protein [Dysgonomonas sp. PH5-37]